MIYYFRVILKQTQMEAPYIEIYTDKSFAVFGDTKPIKDGLKAIGGRFNVNLRGKPGWIFPLNKEEDVKKFLNNPSVMPERKTPVKSNSSEPVTRESKSSTEIKELKERVTVLERLVQNLMSEKKSHAVPFDEDYPVEEEMYQKPLLRRV